MIYRRTRRFRTAYDQLPRNIQEKVIKAFELFKGNPRHPSLVIKKIKGTEDYWEGRIDQFYRFTFQYIDNPNYYPEHDDIAKRTICLFRNIGRHEIIDTDP